MSVDGVHRTYIVYRPATVRASAEVPLVVFLHGGFGSGAQAERSYGWDARADRGHFVVAYPDGIHRAWNAGGGCCGQPARDNVDDVAFLTRMVARLEGELPVDTDRIYATGISNGGIMAYRLACTTTIFAAIGPDSATMLGPCASPAPTSVIHIHGTADTRIPYAGGAGAGVAHIDGPSVPAVDARWRSIDHCGTPGLTSRAPVTTSIARCPDGRAVELVSIAGAGHQWPGSADHPARRRVLGTDAPSTALDATSTIWYFFAAHPKQATPAMRAVG
jgi:polyhydroxybutyrate depolymerase